MVKDHAVNLDAEGGDVGVGAVQLSVGGEAGRDLCWGMQRELKANETAAGR